MRGLRGWRCLAQSIALVESCLPRCATGCDLLAVDFRAQLPFVRARWTPSRVVSYGMDHLSGGPFWRFSFAGHRAAEIGATTVLLATQKHLARLHHLRRRHRPYRCFASGELRNGCPRRGSGCIHHRLCSDQSCAQRNLGDDSAEGIHHRLIVCRWHFARRNTPYFCGKIDNDFRGDSLCLRYVR